MRTAVLTVFYPGMANFLDTYLACIDEQTDQQFELVVVDDDFPGRLEEHLSGVRLPYHVLTSRLSPQANRLVGLEWCRGAGFEVIICSDADETMYPDRVERVRRFFAQSDGADLLYNNSVARSEAAYFDLHYKSVLGLPDLLDFNVLGYGAMNLRASLVPFVLSVANEDVAVFDWWFGLRYLMQFKSVEFRADIKNDYTYHEDNFVGPALELSTNRIEQSIVVKKSIYTEMLSYCKRNSMTDEAHLFQRKADEVEQVRRYIAEHSLEQYFERVRKYFQQKEKIFWWQEAVSLPELVSHNC